MLSRADAGHIQLQQEEISLLRLAEEARSVVDVLGEEKRQRIDIEGDANLLVSVDRLILRQAIINLLDNAIKYSPTESRILVRVQSGENEQVFLDVVDQGPGIPGEHQLEVTKKEASVIHDMASLPAEEQVQFWHDEFMPLAEPEHALRERLLLVGQSVSPERATQ